MNKGVKLIVRIIIVIILLVLGVFSLKFIVGEDGVLTRATTMDKEFSKVEMEEAVGKLVNELLIDSYEKTKKENDLKIEDCFNEQIVLEYLLNAENGLNDKLGYIRPDNTTEPENMITSNVNDEKNIYPVYYVNLSNISNRDSIYGTGTDKASGNVYTIEVQTEEVKNDDGSVTLKSTGVYDLKYYNDESKPETLSTLNFIVKK